MYIIAADDVNSDEREEQRGTGLCPTFRECEGRETRNNTQGQPEKRETAKKGATRAMRKRGISKRAMRTNAQESRAGSHRVAVALLSPRTGAAARLLLPYLLTLTLNPSTGHGIPFEISILVVVPPLHQLQQRVPQRRVHPDGLPWQIAPNAMTAQTLLEERLLKGAAAVERSRRRHPGRIGPTLPSRIVPGAEGVAGAVERAEAFDPRLGAMLPRRLEIIGERRRVEEGSGG